MSVILACVLMARALKSLARYLATGKSDLGEPKVKRLKLSYLLE